MTGSDDRAAGGAMTGSQWQLLLAKQPAVAVMVSLKQQQLFLYLRGLERHCWPVSTATAGSGNQQNSLCTPLGLHSIWKCIGDDQPLGTIFRQRQPSGETAQIENRPQSTGEDLITSRILWMSGEEPSNSSDGCDSRKRYIYIHGTQEEGLIGQPASHGCIRMCNADVISLYRQVAVGTPVFISADL